MLDFPIDQINQFILHKQHLTKETKTDDILLITKNIGGLHCTVQTSPYLSLFNRTNNFSKEILDEEAYKKKNFGKIRCVRKTVFLHLKENIPWIITATRGQYVKRHVDYLANLGIGEEKYQLILKDILKVLKGKELSVSEIKKELNSTENISAMVNLACDEFKIIRSQPIKSWKDKRHTYASFDEYFPSIQPDEFTEEESRRRLVKYYLECYGPATENDIVWWTGFNKTETRAILEDIEEDYARINIQNFKEDYLILKSDIKKLEKIETGESFTVNILPELDSYMMGWKERERYVDEAFYDYVFDRSGNATTSILFDGKVIGIWDFISSKTNEIRFHLLKPVESEVYSEINSHLNKIGEFIFEEEVTLKECKKMEPLKTRTPGEVQTPLKNC